MPSNVIGSRSSADADDLRAEIAHLARRAGGTERRFDDAKPMLVLRLPDGSRLAAIMNVSTVPQVAIRRNVLPAASLDQLVERGTIDRAMHSLLRAAMSAGMRIVVSGETGAGKTTLVRALTNDLPVDTRIVVIEDTRELNLGADPRRADAVLEWETREANIEGVGQIGQRELVRHALRFNPAWLIVGEVRDGDAAREMLLAMQHGHPSVSTVHHHSALSAWKKLAQYVAQGAEAVAFPIAALLISDAVDLFVHLGRDRRGRRAVVELCEVAGWNGNEVQLNRLFVPGADGRGVPRPHLTDARRTQLVAHGFEDHLLLNDAGVVVSASPSLGALVGAVLGLGVVLAVAGWFGVLDHPARMRTRPARSRVQMDRVAVRLALAGGGAVLAFWWTRWPVAAIAVGVLGWSAPSFVGLRARRRRQLARSEAIAVWAEMLRDLLVTNAGLAEAIGKSARVAPVAIRGEVRALYVRAQRGDLAAALARFADDMDDAIADTVVTALQIADQRAVSDLGELLAAVATSTREAVAMQLRIDAARARTYRTAQLIAGIVAFFVGLLVVSNRSYMAPFGTFVGQLVLLGVCAIVAGSVWAMVVLSRPARSERLLRVGKAAVGRSPSGVGW